jgi:hypothetical protein
MGFMLGMLCSSLSMRLGRYSIGSERTSFSVWLMEPTDVNAVDGFHCRVFWLMGLCVSSHALPQFASFSEDVASGATVISSN